MKLCSKCNTQNNDDAVFCANCGANLNNTEQAPQQPTYEQQPVYQQPVQEPVQPQPVQQPVYQQPVQEPVHQQPMYQQQPSVPGKGLGIASMVLGIVSLALFCFVWVSIVCALVGVALGAVAFYKARQVGAKNNMAVAGLACSIVALGFVVIWIIFGAAVAAAGNLGAYNALRY